MTSPDLPSFHAIGSRLRFRQLRLLIAIDDTGSLHRAAEQLSMTQPGASKALKEVEDTFGAELFARHTHGLVPNELGHCVVRYARLIGTDLDHLREEMTGILRGQGGRLAVGGVAGSLPTILVQAVLKLKEKQPAISIELFEDTSARLLQLLSEGRLDLAICRASVAGQPELFDVELFLEERVSVATGPRHPLASAAEVTLEQLAQFPWVMFPSQMPLRTLLERELIEAGLPLPAHAIETSSTFGSLLLLAESNELISLFSFETAAFFERQGIIKRLPIDIASRVEPYGIVRRRGSGLSAAARIFIEELRIHAATLTRSGLYAGPVDAAQ
ncbi:LysR family transcriptional regulator [Paraburkholderia sp. BCC1886]|uniref:LysR family transcriptional regulator n=1 Tax=Paraburkholderia sp. BCC1886 TaxID=2562670 RepID=UPI00118336A0|nr:LysR family transcriptional regulator [Paraburkholderia sp. BCC1886]